MSDIAGLGTRSRQATQRSSLFIAIDKKTGNRLRFGSLIDWNFDY
jgi:hypothetical protein